MKPFPRYSYNYYKFFKTYHKISYDHNDLTVLCRLFSENFPFHPLHPRAAKSTFSVYISKSNPLCQQNTASVPFYPAYFSQFSTLQSTKPRQKPTHSDHPAECSAGSAARSRAECMHFSTSSGQRGVDGALTQPEPPGKTHLTRICGQQPHQEVDEPNERHKIDSQRTSPSTINSLLSLLACFSRSWTVFHWAIGFLQRSPQINRYKLVFVGGTPVYSARFYLICGKAYRLSGKMYNLAVKTDIFASVFNFFPVVGHRKLVQAPSCGTTLNLQRKQHLEVKEIAVTRPLRTCRKFRPPMQ